MMRSYVVAACAALLAANPGSAAAHHSFAAFDRSQQLAVTGTVKDWQWTNPHTWLVVAVPQGAAQTDFSFEGYSPLMLPRFGITRTKFKPGDKVTVTYFPRKDHTNGGQFVGMVAAGAAPPAGRGPATAATPAAPATAPAPAPPTPPAQ